MPKLPTVSGNPTQWSDEDLIEVFHQAAGIQAFKDFGVAISLRQLDDIEESCEKYMGEDENFVEFLKKILLDRLRIRRDSIGPLMTLLSDDPII